MKEDIDTYMDWSKEWKTCGKCSKQAVYLQTINFTDLKGKTVTQKMAFCEKHKKEI